MWDAPAGGVSGSSSTTLTNKTIDADSNTITNISDSNIKTTAAIADSKLATISTAGKVSGSAVTSGTIGGSTAVSTSGSIATTGKASVGVASGTAQLEVKGSGATSATSSLNVANSAGSSSLFVRDDGNVGIGTATPGGRLNIVGSDSTTSPLIVQGAASQTANFFRVEDNTATSQLRLLSDGNLDIAGSSLATGNRSGNYATYETARIWSSNSSYVIQNVNGTETGQLWANAWNPTLSQYVAGIDGTKSLIFAMDSNNSDTTSGIYFTNNVSLTGNPTTSPLMAIKENGSVGIGTTNPGNPLHVAAGGNESALFESSSSAESQIGVSNSSSGRRYNLIVGGTTPTAGVPTNSFGIRDYTAVLLEW